MKFTKFTFLFVFTFSLNLFSYNEIRWDWSKIDTDNISMPKDFLYGVALCEYQNSGATNLPNTNWADWENGAHKNGEPHIAKNQQSGVACDLWHNYKKDIKLMQELGVNSCRFSIDWAKIEPVEGKFNEKALKHYVKVVDALNKAKITPVATLHHFVHPSWYEKLGGFEKVWNIDYFVRFSKVVFARLGSKIPIWCTINEPGCYAFQGFCPLRGVTPPGKKDLYLQGIVIRNLLMAHSKVYRELKAMEGGDKVQIGIVHNILQFEPYHTGNNPVNKLEQAVCTSVNHIFHEAITEFFRSGKFKFRVPALARMLLCDFNVLDSIDIEYNSSATKNLDFFGLNYYSHVLLNIFKGAPDSREGEIWTDMPYTIYAEGFYRAIKEVSSIGVPIYITENGIADKKDKFPVSSINSIGKMCKESNRRELWIKQYFYALSKAIAEGADVRGYFYWSLMDNFEWEAGFDPKFGLYSVNFETQERKLREGSKAFVGIIKKFS